MVGLQRPRRRPDPRGARRGRAQHDDARRQDRTRCAPRSRRTRSSSSCTWPQLPARDADPRDRAGAGRDDLGGRPQVAVSADGTLLHDVPVSALAADDPAGGVARRHARDRRDPADVRLLAAAPYQLLAKVSQATDAGRPRARGAAARRAQASTSAPTSSSRPSGPPRRPCSPTPARPGRTTSTSPFPRGRPPGRRLIPVAAGSPAPRTAPAPRSRRAHPRQRRGPPAEAEPQLEGYLEKTPTLRSRRELGDLQRSLRMRAHR